MYVQAQLNQQTYLEAKRISVAKEENISSVTARGHMYTHNLQLM
jgi:hypothetical protein